MCSIMGFTSGTLTPEQFMPFFERTVSRGPDMSRVEPAGEGYLCFHRLASSQEDGLPAGSKPIACHTQSLPDAPPQAWFSFI